MEDILQPDATWNLSLHVSSNNLIILFIISTEILETLIDSVVNAEGVETGTKSKKKQMELLGIPSRPLFTQ